MGRVLRATAGRRPTCTILRAVTHSYDPAIALRFRGFLPVVIDVETAGFDPARDALLEIAAITLHMDANGHLELAETAHAHIEPFPGANLDPRALAFTGIDPFHPFSTLDTVSLAALSYGHTVLARAVQLAGLSWDEREAHSALYDAERTAQLFCTIVNRWQDCCPTRPWQTPLDDGEEAG
jgi:DNA polymerase III epsilon subunit-like protein